MFWPEAKGLICLKVLCQLNKVRSAIRLFDMAATELPIAHFSTFFFKVVVEARGVHNSGRPRSVLNKIVIAKKALITGNTVVEATHRRCLSFAHRSRQWWDHKERRDKDSNQRLGQVLLAQPAICTHRGCATTMKIQLSGSGCEKHCDTSRSSTASGGQKCSMLHRCHRHPRRSSYRGDNEWENNDGPWLGGFDGFSS